MRSFDPEHISVYGLKIEEGTPFYLEKDTLPLPDEETEYKMYRKAHTILENANYRHYEVSNFARIGFESQHNLRYWKNEKYLGFGVSAHSFFEGQRYAYIDDMEKYMLEMEHPKANNEGFADILSECTDIDIFTKEIEYIMLRMRLFDGINLLDYNRTFGNDFLKKYGEKLKRYADGGFIRIDKTRVAFTVKGMYVSNYILSDILEF